ncbi:hypothetical protein DERF_013126 [Dermatophagoides farinae]|uniref:Uncharacterized protein n=1 Tax=Dermatophagoides farinae TaxID=6954 RepID=A0A922HP17_DERFA|nr:hypothetical protein DERF_013126 [Dermatophagoides farinae]
MVLMPPLVAMVVEMNVFVKTIRQLPESTWQLNILLDMMPIFIPIFFHLWRHQSIICMVPTSYIKNKKIKSESGSKSAYNSNNNNNNENKQQCIGAITAYLHIDIIRKN